MSVTGLSLGSFRLGSPLGAGATGRVYQATHEPSGVDAAVKVVLTDSDRRPVRHSLSEEVRAMVVLDHPSVVRIFDLGEIDEVIEARSRGELAAKTPWYAMELAAGGSLQRRLREVEWSLLSRTVLDLLDALAHAHAREVLHLDLKPSNVLFGADDRAKLSDFGMGVVGALSPEEDVARGTPQYMAPEQVLGRWEDVGPWTDLYALGCLVWRCVTGEPPFAGPTAREVLACQVQQGLGAFSPQMAIEPPLLSAIERWVRRLLHKDPAVRFRRAADAAEAFREALGSPRGPVDWRIPERQGPAELDAATGLGLSALRQPPLVGRTREREQLWDALMRARNGEVRIELISGPRGIGKTRLARWLTVRAHELGLCSSLFAPPRRAEGDEEALVAAIREAIPVDLRSEEAIAELGLRLQSAGLPAPIARDAAAFVARGSHAIEDPSRERGLLDVIEDLLSALSQERTCVIVIDDAHVEGSALVGAASVLLAGRSPPALWLLVIDDDAPNDTPEQRELLARLLALPGARVLPLGPLSEQASKGLARRLLPLAPSLAADLARRGSGLPWLQVEIVQKLASEHKLEPSSEGFRLKQGAQLVSAPGDRVDLGDLPADLLAPLEVAAALGERIDAGEWQSAAAEIGLEVSPALVLRLLGVQVIRAIDARRWTFSSAPLREALLGRASAEGRAAEIHRACARVIDPEDAERRALHLLAAGRPEAALPVLLEAMGREEVGDTARAARLLQMTEEITRGLPLDPRKLSVLEDYRVRVLLATGQTEDALSAARSQLASAEGDDTLSLAAEKSCALSCFAAGHITEAREHTSRAASLAGRSSDPASLASVWVLGSCSARSFGRIAEARRLVEYAALLVLPPRSPSLFEVWLEMALVSAADGRMQAARKALDRLLIEGAAGRSLVTIGITSLVSGDLALSSGDGARALEAYRAARRRLRSLTHEGEHAAQAGLAAALLSLGREEESEAVLQRLRSRTLSPKTRLRTTLAEVALRASRPVDLSYSQHWRTASDLLARLGWLESVTCRALLSLARSRASRPERARQIEVEIERLERGALP